MQSVRPTLATESSTADEPPLLRETKLREHTSEDEKPQATDVQGATPSARAPAGDQEGTVPAIISSKSPRGTGARLMAPSMAATSHPARRMPAWTPLFTRGPSASPPSPFQRAALPFITRRLSAAIAQLRVRLAAASSLGHTDTYTQTAQRTSGPTGTEHTGKVAAGQMRGGKVASRASVKRRRACNETDCWSDSDVDQRVGTRVPTMTARRALACLMRRTQPASRIEPRLALCRNSLARVCCVPLPHI